MKLMKQLALVAALSSVSALAGAMTPIADADLAQVSGQDGVSIAADLHLNIGEFKYTDTSANGGSVSFRNIGINGAIAATLDVISAATFATPGTGEAFSVLGLDPTANTVANLPAFYSGGDVVKIGVPKLDVVAGKQLNMTVDAITMGGSTNSFGSMALNDIKLQGTSVYIWAH